MECASKSTTTRSELNPSAEAIANQRFTSLFQRIITERVATAGPKSNPGHGQLWMANLPRTENWKPTRWDDIENAVNQVEVVQSSGWNITDLNMQEVITTDLDPNDSNAYWSKGFSISGDGRVGLLVRHMRIKPTAYETPCISREEFPHAPLEDLTSVSDELERILDIAK